MTATTHLNFPGIYAITCLKNGYVYIGQAVNVRKRWTHHRWQLGNQTHDNPHLQKAWNKYGPDGFVFEVRIDLRHLSGSALVDALNHGEAAILVQVKKSFNLIESGSGGMQASAETRAKLTAERKARWADPEYRARAIAGMKAKAADPEFQARRALASRLAKSTPERRAKAAEDSLKRWADPKHRKAMGKAKVLNWQDPEYVAKQTASRQATWKDPEVRAKRLAGMAEARKRKREGS